MYTYDDFKKKAETSGLMNEFSDADLRLAQQNPDAGMSILSAKQDYHSATTDDQRALANASANQARKLNGGFTGGAGGDKYYLSNSPSGFKEESWTDPYADQKSELLKSTQAPYTGFNADTDPTAQAYHKSYVREGQRATQDALGTAAQATGGIPSTYAATAAAQSGQYYASKEADKTAELEQAAYDRYMRNKSADLQILSALETLSSNNRGNYDKDRNFGYGQYSDELNYQKNDELRALEQSESKRKENLSELKQRAATMAQVGDFSLYKELGYTDAEIALLKQQYDEAKAAEAAGASTGRSGGSSSGRRRRSGGYSGGGYSGDGYSGADTETGGGISYADAMTSIQSAVLGGMNPNDINQKIESAYNSGAIDNTSYKNMKTAADIIGAQPHLGQRKPSKLTAGRQY